MKPEKRQEFVCNSQPIGKVTWGDFCLLLILATNSLDTDQDQQNVGPEHLS